jgi:hypothetical protein
LVSGAADYRASGARNGDAAGVKFMRKTSRQVHAQNRLLAERSSRYEPTHAQHAREIFSARSRAFSMPWPPKHHSSRCRSRAPSSIAATKVNESKLEAPAISPSFRL